MSIDPAYWGEPFWKTLYSAARGYPLHPSVDHRTAAIHFFESMQLLLPCATCREDYVYLCYKHPIENYVRDREALTTWVNLIENEIREKIGKEPRDLEALLAEIEQFRVKDEQPQADYIMTRKITQQGTAGKKTFVTRRTAKGYEIVPQKVHYYTNSGSPFALQERQGGSGGGGCGCGR